mmetsp:Transcript_4053/g.6242  ORF Transcript_4053/g.6242 Transcript_4053/m.6242 type:complete len:202 (+) Transcript_4053:76-681(+)
MTTATQALRSVMSRISPTDTVFLLCDIQEKFRTVIDKMPNVIHIASRLVKAATVLKIPVIATEQNPSRLGKTVSELELPSGVPVFEKMLFSMVTPEFEAHLRGLPVRSVAIFGIEAHVCVLQTVMDLIQRGYEVHVVMDAISSQRQFDRYIAMERFKQLGAHLTTSESILFQLMGSASHPSFKEVSALCRSSAPVPENLMP